MAFDQRSGPPASTKQMAYLRSLLKAAGHDDFRTARREFGLTQRQAGGKFTSREASAFIDRLLGNEPSDAAASTGTIDSHPTDETNPDARSKSNGSASERGGDVADQWARLVRGVPADVLVNELERRGWSVSPPE